MGDLTSKPEIGMYSTDQRDLLYAPYMKCVLIYHSDLMAIIEMHIRGLRSADSLKKPSVESLDLGKATESYYNFLLVGSCQ